MRSLSLRTETLTDLTPTELAAVAGGGLTDTCVSQRCSGVPCLLSDVVCLEQ